MKKIALILIVSKMFLFLTSCGFLDGLMGDTSGDDNIVDNPPNVNPGDEEENNNGGEGEGGTEENPDIQNIISVNTVDGLNEQIYLNLTKTDGYTYKISYKKSNETSYTELDRNLMIDKGDTLDCYILGISAGNYEVKIEAESEFGYGIKTMGNIDVAAQDRSGYAHFGYDEGVGAYNNDGTMKEGTEILYVTNQNKNTITMTIDGTEYVGLVNIMQKLNMCDHPVIIRIIGRISTNQWKYKNDQPRLVDGSNANDNFFVNTFSSAYGTNLANLKVRYTDKKDGKTYTYVTTENSLTGPTVSGGKSATVTYKGTDYPTLTGKTVYDDDSYLNVIEVKASKNITIEGVGKGAEIFQFGFGFEHCESIEVKNLTFTAYPEDALNFMVDSKNGVAAYGNYWVHNNTFNAGYNAWDITGERDKYAGDGTIDMAFVHNVSIAYNKFNSCKKTMLVGNSDSSRCMNISIHHNYFYKVGSRIPLARNSNVHSFNNYFEECSTCSSVRVNSYLFSEANYFKTSSRPFEISSSAVKSYGDIFEDSSKGSATIATSRTQTVTNSCKPDTITDYSKFDTDSTLFYYDAVKGVTIADYLLLADDVPDFVLTHAGAGVIVQLPHE